MNNSRTIERRAHHVHLTGWSHVLENLRVVCPLHFVCSSSLSRVSLSSPSALAAIAEIAPITHYRCAPLDPSVESAGFEVKIRPSSSSRAAGIRRERVLDASGVASNPVVQIEGTVRTRGNESVPGLCSLSAAATLGVLHFQRVHSEDLTWTPTSSSRSRAVNATVCNFAMLKHAPRGPTRQ
ncbi:uncharacterized protein LOC120702516 isoform X18 [Panicum virgatum]|uniref:uncharacterized protein LOC120702516 isoform X18 n=1 Tax=Panicum virgatum TaxID=38727 RepID=UPI0019D5932C|nr:uncharacterized protein LOC120702516 isoform X18 [Panicum virgatum]